jgi:hypothetical protein
MKKIKLAKLPDRVPVKLTVTLPSQLAARLRSYADLYAEQYGTREEPAELVPYILDAFLRSDVELQRAIRENRVKQTGDREPSSAVTTQTRIGPDSSIRELRKQPHTVGPRSEVSEG